MRNLLPVVPRITAEIEAMAGGAACELSRGGGTTKIEAGKIAVTGGTHMVIADGRVAHPVSRLTRGAPCTWFLTPSNPVTTARNGSPDRSSRAAPCMSTPARRARCSPAKSLLPAGVTRVEGDFTRGDSVLIRDAGGGEARSAAAWSPMIPPRPRASLAASRMKSSS